MLKKLRIISTVFLLLLGTFLQAQPIDSLKSALQEHSDGLAKLEIYSDLTKQLIFSHPDEGILYGRLMLNLANSLDEPAYASKANRVIGIAFAQQGNHTKAIQYFEESFTGLGHTQQLRSERAKILNNIGLTYGKMKKYREAFKYLNHSLSIKRDIDDNIGIANTLNNIGLNYYDMEAYEDALGYFLESLEIRQKNNISQDLPSSYINIGGIYFWLKDYDTSFEYYDKAIGILDTNTSSLKLAKAYAGKAETLIKTKEYDRARKYIEKTIDLSRLLSNDHLLAKMWKLLGQIEQGQGKDELAKLYYEKSLNINDTTIVAGEILVLLGDLNQHLSPIKTERLYRKGSEIGEKQNSLRLKINANKRLSNFHLEKNDHKKALAYQLKYESAKDSLFEAQNMADSKPSKPVMKPKKKNWK